MSKDAMAAQGPLDRGVRWLRYQARMLKHRPRLWWHRLWIRRDEFHRSLDMDSYAMLDMNEEDSKAYINDLMRRRQIAHERDLAT